MFIIKKYIRSKKNSKSPSSYIRKWLLALWNKNGLMLHLLLGSWLLSVRGARSWPGGARGGVHGRRRGHGLTEHAVTCHGACWFSLDFIETMPLCTFVQRFRTRGPPFVWFAPWSTLRRPWGEAARGLRRAHVAPAFACRHAGVLCSDSLGPSVFNFL